MTIWKDDDELDNPLDIALNISREFQLLPLCTHEKALQDLVAFLNKFGLNMDTQHTYCFLCPFDPPSSERICRSGGIFDLAEVLPSGLNSSEKHHVAKFAPVLATASTKYVHHMILFECSDEARTC